jgi:hypothetical protein
LPNNYRPGNIYEGDKILPQPFPWRAVLPS